MLLENYVYSHSPARPLPRDNKAPPNVDQAIFVLKHKITIKVLSGPGGGLGGLGGLLGENVELESVCHVM